MSNQALKITVKEWVEKIGKPEAIKRLVLRGVSPVTADKICGLRYHSTPGGILSTVLDEEFKREGIRVGEAS